MFYYWSVLFIVVFAVVLWLLYECLTDCLSLVGKQHCKIYVIVSVVDWTLPDNTLH